MPSKRSKRERSARVRVTAEAVDQYRQAKPLRDGRIACVESTTMCDHADCDEYTRLNNALCRELHVRPWEPSPLGDESPLHDELEAACAH